MSNVVSHLEHLVQQAMENHPHHWSDTEDSGSVATHRNPMTKFTLRKEQHKAEILYAVKCVMSHFSFNSSTDITYIFQAMFPDSAIAQKMKFGSNRLSYLIC